MYPFLTMFSREVPKFYEDSEGGVSIFTHTKKETEQSKISLSHNSPAALDAPFARLAPAALRSFQHPGGVRGYPFLITDSRVS